MGTWNIKGLRTKQKEVVDELKRFQMDIVALAETKRKGRGSEQIDDYVHLYSGVDKANRAKAGISLLIRKRLTRYIKDWDPISERIIKAELNLKGYEVVLIGIYAPTNDEPTAQKDEFWEKIAHVLDNISNRKEIILLGDFNGHVGSKTNNDIVGPYGGTSTNDNGERLIGLCHEYTLRIQNGFFRHKDIHRYTWVQPTLQRKSIIDFIITKQYSHVKLYDVRVHRGAECGTDHYLLRARIFFPIKIHPVTKPENYAKEVPETKYNIDSLKDNSTAFLYKIRLNLKLASVAYSSGADTYNEIIKCVKEAAYEALGELRKTGNNNKTWWTDNIERIVHEKKRAHNKWLITRDIEDRKYYTRCCREVKKAVLKAKNESWDNKCRDIDQTIGYSRSSEAWRTRKH